MAARLEPLLNRLVHMTWRAALPVCLIRLVQQVFACRLGGRGRHALWFPPLIRKALPWAPASGLSMHNLLPAGPPSVAASVWAAHPVSLGPLSPSALGRRKQPAGPERDAIVGVRSTPHVLTL